LNIQLVEIRRAIHILSLPCGQIVHHDDVVTFLYQAIDYVRTDEPGATRH
jgi:hypothetical protein